MKPLHFSRLPRVDRKHRWRQGGLIALLCLGNALAAPKDSPPRAGHLDIQRHPALPPLHAMLIDDKEGMAHRRLLELVRQHPQRIDAWLSLAAIAAREGDTLQARDYVRSAYWHQPLDPRAFAAHTPDSAPPLQAASRLRQALAEQPGQPALHFALGRALAAQGEWAAAREAFVQALHLDPEQPDTLYNLAICHEHLGESEPARERYGQALRARTRRAAAFPAEVAEARQQVLQGKMHDER